MNSFGNNTSNSTSSKYKYKPYRNRPSKRQACIELLSFLILVCAAPAFLGGVISIFVCFFGFILGLLGLFAWTRRHALLFAVLSALLVALCIVNIVLRSVFVGQCLPFYQYQNLFSIDGHYSPVDGVFNTKNPQHNSDSYTQSIWCGNREILYITNGLVILLGVPAHIMALCLLFRQQNKNLRTQPVSNTTTTTTTEAWKQPIADQNAYVQQPVNPTY